MVIPAEWEGLDWTLCVEWRAGVAPSGEDE